MIGTYARGGQFKCRALGGGHSGNRRINLGLRKDQLLGRQTDTIKFLAKGNQGCIAITAHLRNDIGNHRIYIRAILALHPEKCFKRRLKIRRIRVQKNRHTRLRQNRRGLPCVGRALKTRKRHGCEGVFPEGA